MRALALMMIPAAMTLSAADPQYGTWKVVSIHITNATPAPQLTIAAQPNGLKYLRVNKNYDVGAKDEWAAKFDGNRYPVSGDPASEAVAIRRKGARAIEVTFWKGDTGTVREFSVSDDGKLLIVKTAKTGQIAGVFERVGEESKAEDPLVGSWIRNDQKAAELDPQTVTVEPAGPDGEHSKSQFEYTLQYDGKDYPLKDNAGWMISARRTGQNKLQRTLKRDGKVVEVCDSSYSPDGNEETATCDYPGVAKEVATYRKQPAGAPMK